MAAFIGGGGGGGGGGGSGDAGLRSDLVTGVTKGPESEFRGIAGNITGEDALGVLDSFSIQTEEAEAVEVSGSDLRIS